MVSAFSSSPLLANLENMSLISDVSCSPLMSAAFSAARLPSPQRTSHSRNSGEETATRGEKDNAQWVRQLDDCGLLVVAAARRLGEHVFDLGRELPTHVGRLLRRLFAFVCHVEKERIPYGTSSIFNQIRQGEIKPLPGFENVSLISDVRFPLMPDAFSANCLPYT